MTQQSETETIPISQAVEQVRMAVDRASMLYYHFATTLVSELGEARGKELIEKAIAGYGQEVGERHRQKVIDAGFEPTLENYKSVLDVPRLVWNPRWMPVVERDGERVPVCPMGAYWIEKGAEELGRLYCHVDQAKYAAYDPEVECRHLSNVLDGDRECQVVAKRIRDWAKIDGGTV